MKHHEPVIKISTPLGDKTMLFKSMVGCEALGIPSVFDIELLSRSQYIEPDKILAKRVTLSVELPSGQARYFDGFVSRFMQHGSYNSYYRYSIRVKPWLWFLSKTSNCRIFQDMAVPDIVKKIFSEHKAIADFEFHLIESYSKQSYCVQYRESDYDFVVRLLEQEGIYFYFKHSKGRHILTLVDSYSGHQFFSGYENIPYLPHDAAMQQEYERILTWGLKREVQTGQFIMDDFDYSKPNVDLRSAKRSLRGSDFADYEWYDFPGRYSKCEDGARYAQIRLDALQAQYETVQGTANARGIAAGHLFSLTQHARQDQNREYLVTFTSHRLHDNRHEASRSANLSIQSTFTALSVTQQFRPLHTVRKPIVKGLQTAIVVGPEGHEIYTDQYGRVKVQFHWDREG